MVTVICLEDAVNVATRAFFIAYDRWPSVRPLLNVCCPNSVGVTVCLFRWPLSSGFHGRGVSRLRRALMARGYGEWVIMSGPKSK